MKAKIASRVKHINKEGLCQDNWQIHFNLSFQNNDYEIKGVIWLTNYLIIVILYILELKQSLVDNHFIIDEFLDSLVWKH